MKNRVSIFILFCVGSIVLNSCKNFNNNKKPSSIDQLSEQIQKTPNNAKLFFDRGKAYQQLKLDSMAAEDFVKATELDSTNADYASKATAVLFDRKDGRSIQYIQKTLALNPNDAIAHLKIATINYYNKNYAGAFGSINTVLRSDVNNYDAYFLKGLCYKELGDTLKAISSFQTASRMNPESSEAYLQLGMISSKKDKLNAIMFFENAYKADTNNVEPLNGIGLIYQERKENNEAKKAFIRCINAKPSFAKAFYNIGCILIDEDSIEKATRQFNIAIQHDPQFVDAYFNRGLCYELLKNKTAALKDFEQVLQINPDYKLAIEAKQRVQ